MTVGDQMQKAPSRPLPRVSLNSHGYAIVNLSTNEAATVARAREICSNFFKYSTAEEKAEACCTSKFGYKLATVKERLQFRLPCEKDLVAALSITEEGQIGHERHVSLEESASVVPTKHSFPRNYPALHKVS
eukprot:m.1105137 g.1105137  ORF g.1105137 m.1105137 type:complete len:132 (-) comp24336_c0_seq28:4427-4822(-)